MIIEFSQVGAGFIDGLMISRYLGPDEMAAEGIIHPLFSILGVISGMLAIGMQVRCSRSIGRGNRDEFVRFFSATVYCGTAVSLLTAVLIIVFSKPFAVLLGVSENAANLLEPASKYAMGLGFGVYGILACYTVSDALTLLAIFVFYTVKKRGKLPKRDDYLSLSDEFYLKPGDVISLDIRDMYDVVLASEQVMLFCKGHKIDRKIAFFAALSVEEPANNIVEYGFVKNRSAHPIIDFRAVITDDRFVIRLSDNCPHYDITELIGKANAKGADKTKNIGIRIVSNVASDIGYMHVFETNKLIITFVCR